MPRNFIDPWKSNLYPSSTPVTDSNLNFLSNIKFINTSEVNICKKDLLSTFLHIFSKHTSNKEYPLWNVLMMNCRTGILLWMIPNAWVSWLENVKPKNKLTVANECLLYVGSGIVTLCQGQWTGIGMLTLTWLKLF